ncbi:hypothetical protein GW813_05760, partial [bacterium]|nr:hypothetical protein [bacterium]
MKLKLIPIFIATFGVAFAAPEGLESGVPAFLDTDGDGVISEAERQAFAESRRAAPRGGASAWDTNGDGVIDEGERLAAIQALRAKADERRAALFTKIAGDDGLLDASEFATIPALATVPQETIDRLFALLDTDSDGAVTLEEFLAGI